VVEHLDLSSPRFVTIKDAQDAVRTILFYLGEDPDRDGLQRTPARVIEALTEMSCGHHQDVAEMLSVQFAQEETRYGGIVALRRIPFASLCEHHVLPFVGTADVAYIPGDQGRIVGLSTRTACKSRSASPCKSSKRSKSTCSRRPARASSAPTTPA